LESNKSDWTLGNRPHGIGTRPLAAKQNKSNGLDPIGFIAVTWQPLRLSRAGGRTDAHAYLRGAGAGPQRQRRPAARPQQVNPAPAAADSQSAAPAPLRVTASRLRSPKRSAASPRLTSGRPDDEHVSLSELIDTLAKQMKINYILDPRVKGSVTIYTYASEAVDLMQLLETILRVNAPP